MARKISKSYSVHVNLINFIQWLAQQVQPLKLKKFRYIFGLLLILNLLVKFIEQPFFCTLLYYLFFTTMFFSYFDTLLQNQVLFQLRQEKDTTKRLSTLLKLEEQTNLEKIKILTKEKEEISRNAKTSAKLFQHELKTIKLELKNSKKNYQEQTRRQGIYSVIYLAKMKKQIEQLQNQLNGLAGKQRLLSGNYTEASNQGQKQDLISIIIQKFQKLQNYYLSQLKQLKIENNSSMKLSSRMANLNKQVWQRAMTGKSQDEQIQKLIDYQLNNLRLIIITLLRERKESAKIIQNYENSLIEIKNIININFRLFTNSDSLDIEINQDKVQGIIKRVINLFESLHLYKQSLGNAEQMLTAKDQQIQKVVQTQVNKYQQMIYKLSQQNKQIKIGYEEIIRKFQYDIQRLNKQKEQEKSKEKSKGREKEKVKQKIKIKEEEEEEQTNLKYALLSTFFQNKRKEQPKMLRIDHINKKYIDNEEQLGSDNQ